MLAIPALKALGPGPGFQQRAINREVFVRGQALGSRLFHHLPQEPLGHLSSTQSTKAWSGGFR